MVGGSCLPQGRISAICTLSILRNDRKCKIHFYVLKCLKQEKAQIFQHKYLLYFVLLFMLFAVAFTQLAGVTRCHVCRRWVTVVYASRWLRAQLERNRCPEVETLYTGFIWRNIKICFLPQKMYVLLQCNPSGKARNVSLKLQNLVHFHAPLFTNHAYFTPHDRPPLLKGHHLGWPLQKGSTVFLNTDLKLCENLLFLKNALNLDKPWFKLGHGWVIIFGIKIDVVTYPCPKIKLS